MSHLKRLGEFLSFVFRARPQRYALTPFKLAQAELSETSGVTRVGELLNGTVITPGEWFSWKHTIGPALGFRGFTDHDAQDVANAVNHVAKDAALELQTTADDLKVRNPFDFSVLLRAEPGKLVIKGERAH